MHQEYPTGPEVVWEKWEDVYVDSQAADDFDEDFGDTDELDFDEVESLMEMEGIKKFEQPIQAVFTPFGILPLTERNAASKHFKLWVAHTNFKISHQHIKIVEDCKGIEAIDPLTPYRMRVAIGRLFRDRDVMNTVKKALLRNVK